MKFSKWVFAFALFVAHIGTPSAFAKNASTFDANAFPIRFMSFNVVGLCISGNNHDGFEKTFVDSFAIWTCSHYLHPIVIGNGSYVSKKQLSETDLIEKNKESIIQYFRSTGKRRMDLYLFGHSNEFAQPIRNLLEDLEKRLGYPIELRFVYNSGCYNFEDDRPLQEVAKTYVGHKGLNYGPVYSPLFLEQWFTKIPAGIALTISNVAIDRRPFTTTEAGSVEDFAGGVFDRTTKEDNDPKGYLTGNSRAIF